MNISGFICNIGYINYYFIKRWIKCQKSFDKTIRDSILDVEGVKHAIIMTRACSIDKSGDLKFYPKNILILLEKD